MENWILKNFTRLWIETKCLEYLFYKAQLFLQSHNTIKYTHVCLLSRNMQNIALFLIWQVSTSDQTKIDTELSRLTFFFNFPQVPKYCTAMKTERVASTGMLFVLHLCKECLYEETFFKKTPVYAFFIKFANFSYFKKFPNFCGKTLNFGYK